MIRISLPSAQDQLLVSVLYNQTMHLKFCFPFKKPNPFNSLLLWLIQEKWALLVTQKPYAHFTLGNKGSLFS